jgi:two-component system chemotaxis response regulator CheB
LASVLSVGTLRPITVTERTKLEHGSLYVPRPNAHLVIDDAHVRLDPGPRENGFRPSIDRLFRTAALAVGPRVIGVVLSGMRDNGAEGLALIKRCGGVTIVQSPEEAMFRAMPDSALDRTDVDHVVKLQDMVPILVRRTREEVPATAPKQLPVENDPGAELVNVCPACGGVAREVTVAGFTRYLCRTGHSYSPESFVRSQGEHVEEAMWSAVNALSERGSTLRRMAAQARTGGHERLAQRYDALSADAAERAETIRSVLLAYAELPLLPDDEPETA